MAAHARLGPSGADRWMICRGSVRLIERLRAQGIIPPDSSSPAAAEGSVAHLVRSDSLDLGLDPHDWVGQSIAYDGYRFDVTEEMAEHLQSGIDWAREQPGTMYVEYRVDLSRWLPGQFGTLDLGIVPAPWLPEDDQFIDIDDLKYGAGIKVEAVGTRQLRIYALGFWDKVARHVTDCKKFRLTIDQPRAGGFKEWIVTLDELLAFGEEVEAAGRAIMDGDETLVASEKGCMFCPVKDTDQGCPAYTKWMDSFFDGVFEDLPDDLTTEPVFTDRAGMDPGRRYYIVRHAHLASKWLASLHEDSMDAARNGTPDPGSKLVPGQRGDRAYVDQAKARTVLIQTLGTEAYTRKLLSPAQAEKLIKPGKKVQKKYGSQEAWDAICDLVVQPEGRPILVPAEDPREALPTWEEQFDDLDVENRDALDILN